MKSTRIKKALVAAAAAAVLLGTTVAGAAPADAAAGVRHVISVTTDSSGAFPWQASGYLHAGNGNLVYHWHEGHKAGKGYVRWEFTYYGDNGWLDLYVYPSGDQKFSYLHKPLNQDYCYHINAPELGPFSTVSSC